MVQVKKQLVNNYQVGSDAEFFVRNKQTQEIISAEGLIKGTKYEPFHFDKNNPFYATSLDNVLAEGNIPPCTTEYDFWKAIEKLRKHIDANLPAELETVAIPAARLDFKWLQTDNARIFGCDPSLNCWTREGVYPQPNGDNVRSAGFHIHIGYDDPSEETNYLLGKAADLFLGLPAVLIEPENERKSVGYGCAGNIRMQRHGMEYRSLSSYLSSSPRLVKWCFRQAQHVVEFVNDGKVDLIENRGEEIQSIINNEDKKAAKSFIKEFGIELA